MLVQLVILAITSHFVFSFDSITLQRENRKIDGKKKVLNIKNRKEVVFGIRILAFIKREEWKGIE